MEGITLKARAIAFAFSTGATAFILALLATADPTPDTAVITRALVVATICGTMSWAAAERALSGIAVAIDKASARIVAAAEGDLTGSTPPEVVEELPVLGAAMSEMFEQVRASLDNANRQAMFDSVTALPNRAFFRSDADRLLQTMREDEVGAIVFIDLDNFKAVNDTLGHAHGDQLLVKVANRLRAIAAAETVRNHGSAAEVLVGRLAGDEFTLLLPHITGRDDAARLANAIVTEIGRPFELAGQRVQIGASVGVAMRPEHGRTLTALMRAADVAMYDAKANGRGQMQFYRDALAERLSKRAREESDLRQAIADNQFTLVYQPQVRMRDNAIIAAEGLLRWNHPKRGLLLPAEFLPCAEDTGLIFDLGDWAIEESAKRVAAWPNDALAERLALNLSPRQIMRPEFFARLRGAFARHGASMRWVEFEVSEAVVMSCGPRMLEQLAILRHEGARIAIDDFGAGFSSLVRLRSLPIDQVKLDRCIVADIEQDAGARDILQSVIGLVHGLGATAVAEGVETAAQLKLLKLMGCDAVQGFAVAQPMAEDDYRHWIDGVHKRAGQA